MAEGTLDQVPEVCDVDTTALPISLVLKGNRWSKVSSRAAESFDSQRSESRLHMAAACADGASRCAGGTPSKAGPWSSVTGGPPSKAGPWSSVIRAPTPSAQPTVSPAPRGLGPKLPFSTVTTLERHAALGRGDPRHPRWPVTSSVHGRQHASFMAPPSVTVPSPPTPALLTDSESTVKLRNIWSPSRSRVGLPCQNDSRDD
ncbi:unnamed protein product [Rangifer tarandus platyrhynchus]|uniref:Uncharacterized protein n=1 Tax=Rangifer tarandus platyrhynchus TaxID=3082113 RepID=A0AC59Z180_RANTA